MDALSEKKLVYRRSIFEGTFETAGRSEDVRTIAMLSVRLHSGLGYLDASFQYDMFGKRSVVDRWKYV